MTPAQSPTELLQALVRAQDNFFRLSGRFSMTFGPLVRHGFLDASEAKALENQAAPEGWRFETKMLPFPDEDVSWCHVARGPDGQVILAVTTGLWTRHDGNCPLDRDQLPPTAPWKRHP